MLHSFYITKVKTIYPEFLTSSFQNTKKIIFVHGCFWHMHHCRYGRVIPATRTNFWQTKRRGNVLRDRRNLKNLKSLGWHVLIVWECQIRDIKKLSATLKIFLSLPK